MAKRNYVPPRVGASDKYIMKVVYKSHIIINTDKAIKALGSWAVGRIKLRTQQGLDMKGKPFAQYSEGYGGKNGALKRGGEQASPIDLRVSGTMLGDMKVTGRGKRMGYDYVTIGFSNKKMRKYRLKDNQIQFTGKGKGNITTGALARVHHYGIGKMPKRAFFGLTKGEKQRASQHAMQVGIVRQGTGAPRRLLSS